MQEAIISVLEVGQVFEGDGCLHRAVARLDALQTLFGRDIQVNNQVGLAPKSCRENEKSG